MEESKAKDVQKCAGCLNNIVDEEYVSALEQDWHKDCFRCSVCDAALSSWYFEKNGLLFCQADYWARFGESCQQCSQVITGPVMAAGSHRFHPECFACAACAAPIEDAEPYALLERTRLYCGACYRATGATHSIRVLSVPSSALKAEPAPGNTLAVTEYDPSCGVVTLHIGDRILEINGAPPRASALDARPPTLLQLTIEHNPDTTRTRKTCILPDKQTTDTKDEHIPIDKTIDDKHSIDQRPIDKVDQVDKDKTEELEREGRRERLFKRKGDDGGRTRVIKRRQTPASPLLGEKERSSSMSKLLDVSENSGDGTDDVLCELSRARSFRAQPDPRQKVFRACDLIQGELLGSGFFGEVYKVTHRATGDVMVLKQLYRVDDDAQNNFLKEVAVLRSLSHPNVLKFVGVVYKDKRLHLVTEYVAGGTLHQLIQDSSVSLSWSSRARVARDVAAGVGYLHRRNVIHRDLNSHNCLVREDKTVIVADFGLARLVQRAASSAPHAAHSLRRKRYTVVGNPYWMAPEMMNGKVYDEKVDVFSFGVILCEIIGRVSADPDFLPRRADFGLNEALFKEKFCRHSACPEPFYQVAFQACQLDPDRRPPFEVIETWLESLVQALSKCAPPPPALLADILSFARPPHAPHAPCDCGPPAPCRRQNKACCQQDACCHCHHTYSHQSQCCVHAYGGGGGGERCAPAPAAPAGDSDADLVKSKCKPMALGKCVSASHICAARRVTVTSLSRSHNALTNPGYILRAVGHSINITKVDDISAWLDSPRPLRRSPLARLDLPPFLRNQSVEGLESQYKQDLDTSPFYRHVSLNSPQSADDSDSSDDELIDCNWYKNVSNAKKIDPDNNIINNIIKKGESLLKKSSYDVADVMLRNPESYNERKFPEDDQRRFNIDYMKRTPIMAEGIKNIPKNIEVPKEKNNFFSKKLLSPKLSRLFKPNTAEVVRNKPEDEKEEKSRSKFFIQPPTTPITRSYRVRPVDGKQNQDVLKSDIKLASMGKPMTPTFRRHMPNERPDFADTRFSYRVKTKTEKEPKFVDIGRNRIKAPVPIEKKIRAQNQKVIEEKPRRREGISRSNYVSLANLKIGKGLEDKEKDGSAVEPVSPMERVV